MATITPETLQGTITDIGPMYPFVGTEGLLVILCVIFWIGWHIWQARMESRIYEKDMAEHGDQLSMTEILKGEKLYKKLDQLD